MDVFSNFQPFSPIPADFKSLIALSIYPWFTEKMAAELLGTSQAEVVSMLACYPIIRNVGSGYYFMPFMQKVMQLFFCEYLTVEEQNQIYRKAARTNESFGRTFEALKCYKKYDSERDVLRLAMPLVERRHDLESLISEKTRMICFCNPHNPFGKNYTDEQLQTILDLSEKYDLWIMNDEIWSDIIYSDGRFKSLHAYGAELNRRTASVYGFSKGFGIAGLRAGCVYTQNREVFDKLVKTSLVMSTAGGISSLSQVAAEACLTDATDWVQGFLNHLEDNRDFALSRIEKMPKISCHKPEATFLLFPSIRETGLDSQTFCDRLKYERKLALVPGSEQFFGPGSEGFIRISYATSREILSEAMNRLEAFLTSL